MPRTMLVTGATGVVGHDLVGTARRAGWEVVGCSARGEAGPGGAVAWRMGAEPPPGELRRPWDVVVHAAARPKWNLDDETARQANVLPLADLAEVVGPDTHLVHVSTAYAIGRRGDTASTDRADYRNSYEWSKAEAERIVAARWPDATIVRPPLVVGRRGDGAVARFSGLYTIVRSAVAGMLPVFVAETGALSEVVSCCDVTACLLAAAERGPVPGGRVDVLGRGTASATTKEVLDAMFVGLNRWRADQGGPLFTPPSLVTPDQWHRFYLPFARPHMTQRQRHFTDLLAEYLPYMAITEPMAVTWQVEPVLGCIEQSIVRWAETFPRLAMATPAPWVGQDDEDDDELETA
ncbi:MAG TPA: SDR family oxidoreductase [Mycobacteriales bacterium]|nr:SDR family oxidoreductase [Mycobacteriales bacterium]